MSIRDRIVLAGAWVLEKIDALPGTSQAYVVGLITLGALAALVLFLLF
jgi:hypothetical protein